MAETVRVENAARAYLAEIVTLAQMEGIITEQQAAQMFKRADGEWKDRSNGWKALMRIQAA